MFKRSLVIFLVILLVIPTMVFAEKGGNGKDWGEDETIKIVSLGDSIATGYVTDMHHTMAYPYRLEKYLRGPKKVEFNDWSKKGLSLNELFLAAVDYRNNPEGNLEFHELYQDLMEADIIVISLVGNDLLEVAAQHAVDYPDVDLIQLQTDIAEVTDSLSVKWMKAFNWLNRVKKADAEVYVLNIYNPLLKMLPEDELYDFVDGIINDVNMIISLNALDKYTVIDVYNAFKGYDYMEDEVTFFYSEKYFMNPHPTQKGQNVIFDLVRDAMAE